MVDKLRAEAQRTRGKTQCVYRGRIFTCPASRISHILRTEYYLLAIKVELFEWNGKKKQRKKTNEDTVSIHGFH